jgi:hypothetical protein
MVALLIGIGVHQDIVLEVLQIQGVIGLLLLLGVEILALIAEAPALVQAGVQVEVPLQVDDNI